MRVLIYMLSAAALLGPPARAGSWSATPRIGLSSDYSTNPELRIADERSESHAAALINLPLNYDTDSAHFSLIPSARYSDSSGYASLASNYQRLDANAQFMSDLGSWALLGGVSRDSSLYHGGESGNGVGVRRDTASASVQWERTLTARTQTQWSVSWSRIRYAQDAAFTNLVDNRYVDVAPSLSFAVSERNTLKLLGSAGRYQSLDGFTKSDDVNLQLGFDRQISEMWLLSTSAGYSRSNNTYNFFFGSVESKQKGAVYSATLTRQAERLSFGAGVSRALKPSGFAFLSRQDAANVNVNFNYSERWAFNLAAAVQKATDPQVNGGNSSRRYVTAQASADWHWTLQWIVSLHALRYRQEFGSTAGAASVSAVSNGLSLEIARQFLRTEL